jgi:general secretion pathway protein M
MNRFDALRLWYAGLQQRERQMVVAAVVLVVLTLFYLIIWEPVHNGLDEQRLQYDNQRATHSWMAQAAEEARQLKATGSRNVIRNSNQPVSLLVERSATTAGLKNSISKIETSGDKGARVMLDAASFDQMLLWLNTLRQQYGITVSSASIDRNETGGTVNARLTLDRN